MATASAAHVEGEADGAVVEGTGSSCSSCYRTAFDTTCIRSPPYGGRATEHGLARIAVGAWAPDHWHRSSRLHRWYRIDVPARRADCAVATPICDRKCPGLFHPYPGLRSSMDGVGHRAHSRCGRGDCCHAFANSDCRTRAPVW